MIKTVNFVRGIPGSGKNTLAESLTPGKVLSADEFFMKKTPERSYEFDPTKLGEAHAWCFRKFLHNLNLGVSFSVANTFTQSWEYDNYVSTADMLGWDYTIHDIVADTLPEFDTCFSRQIHGVPLQSCLTMWHRFEKATGFRRFSYRVSNLPMPSK